MKCLQGFSVSSSTSFTASILSVCCAVLKLSVGSLHFSELLLDLLVLSLGSTVSISEVSVAIWVIAIINTLSSETVWLLVVWVEWSVILDLGEVLEVSVDWSSGESVFVAISTREGLSDDPGEFLPQVVLDGDEGDLVHITG